MKPSIFNAYRALFSRHQTHRLNMGGVDGIDVCGLIFIVSVRGNMSIAFGLVLKIVRTWKHIHTYYLLRDMQWDYSKTTILIVFPNLI